MKANIVVKKVIEIFSIVSLFSLFVFLSSCNDLPTDLGYNLIQDTLNVKVITSDDTTIIVGTEIPKYAPSAVNATKILCGNSNGIKALSVFRFGNIPDSLSYLKESDIISAELFLFPSRYALGDTLNQNYSFSVKKVEQYWSVSSDWDSISVAGFFGRDIASYSGSIPLKDTMEKITINIDKKMIPEWFKLRTDTNAAVINWGIALIPDDGSNVVHSFGGEGVSATATNSPVMKIVYTNSNSKIDSVFLYTGLNASFIKYPKFNDNDIVIQSGLDVRTNLSFDISMIPQFSGISKMELLLTLDTTKSYFGNLKAKTAFRIDFVSDSTGPRGSYYYYAEKTDTLSNVFKCVSVTSAAELWNRFSGKGKLQIRAVDFESQFQRLDKMVFYGNDCPDPKKRPKVKIIYSTNFKKH